MIFISLDSEGKTILRSLGRNGLKNIQTNLAKICKMEHDIDNEPGKAHKHLNTGQYHTYMKFLQMLDIKEPLSMLIKKTGIFKKLRHL